jgi:NitT/TauT family transport system permease protein
MPEIQSDVPSTQGGARKHKSPFPDTLAGRISLGSVLPVLMLLAWWAGIRSGTAVVPTFSEVARVLLNPFETPSDIYSRSLAFSTGITLMRLGLGFGLGVLTALPLGLLAGRYSAVDRLLAPMVQIARPINPIVLLPIATVIFGLASLATVMYGGQESWRYDVMDQVQLAMIIILWWGAFFPIFISTVHGVRSVRHSHVETLGLMGASDAQVFRHVILPHTLPHSASGMRIGMGVAWLVLIAAEVYPGTRSGLGYMLCVACKTSDYEYTFAAIIVIGIVAWLTDTAIARLEHSTGHWQAVQR